MAADWEIRLETEWISVVVACCSCSCRGRCERSWSLGCSFLVRPRRPMQLQRGSFHCQRLTGEYRNTGTTHIIQQFLGCTLRATSRRKPIHCLSIYKYLQRLPRRSEEDASTRLLKRMTQLTFSSTSTFTCTQLQTRPSKIEPPIPQPFAYQSRSVLNVEYHRCQLC